MQTKLDEAKAELLERAARVAENSPVGGHLPTGTTGEGTPDTPDGPDGAPDYASVSAFLQRYYRHTAPEDLADRDPVDIFGAAVSHYRLAENRPQGTANVRVHTPTVEENGWTCSHSVVEVVTDDMPFLVDSVTNELTRQGRGIHVVVHPQIVVRRDIAGKLVEVLAGPPTADLPHDAHVESWIHVEIDRETDRADLKQITADLLRVLNDVRETVEDWGKMRDAAVRIADQLSTEATPEDLPARELEEARELLRWLADDHFTFLGYREYRLREDDSLAAVAGTGLGILRSDPHHATDESHPVSPSFERLPADARAKAREHRLLVLTKANSRATVHRPSYLDYVGVKKFDENGNVVGERRFLGLFSSAAYTESVRRVPVVRRKVEEVLERAGFSPNSHDGRDLLQILETYPRDEMFQTSVEELEPIVTSVLYLQERRRLRLYLRQDEYGRYYSALVYLPRDRYTTGVRLRIIDILKEELGGTSVDFTAWNTESILSPSPLRASVRRELSPQSGSRTRAAAPAVRRSTRERVDRPRLSSSRPRRSWADMSGDVFGNGMLLSEHIRLVAAFDHRHIFIDPNPDAATSYAERRRLFELPRSSWEDYNTELLSAGGGIFPRTAKSIPVNAHVREALGIEAGITKMTPAELMKAILSSPVDLLWNGGIGTYVKASTESNADVGDKGNDAIRVDGKDLRVQVVGEGGNLGLTQLGRIEFALQGGRINTDAIDNSAGVDTSDHEVNIKILLNGLVKDGDMTVKQRNKLLAQMTDEVGALVLRNNYAQNTAIANALAQSKDMLHAQQRFMRHLVREGHLNRALEFLPTDRQIRERLSSGHGLTGPETAVLLAYTKITVAEELLHTSLPDDPYLKGLLHAYFPSALREQFAEQVDSHPLRREITTTVLVNDTVNTGGTTYLHRMREETGASLEEIVRAQTAARAIFSSSPVWDAVEALDTKVDAAVQTRIRLHSRRLVERGTRWLLNNRPQPLELAETVDFFAERVEQVWSQLPKLLRGADAEWYQHIHDELTAAGVPDEPATRVAGFSSAFATLDIVSVADRMGREPLDVAEVYYDLADRLGVTQLMDRISDLPRNDRWQSMARAAIREDLYSAHASLTADVLAVGNGTSTPEQRFKAWEEKNAAILGRARTTLEEIRSSDEFDLSNLSVAMRTMRTLLRTHS
ncbi:hypothetical protein STENM36S_02272 [Streptomyces tendae]